MTLIHSAFDSPDPAAPGSETRTFWLEQLGLTEAQLGPTVTDLAGDVSEGSAVQLSGPGDIMPMSVASYISQGNHAALPIPIAEGRGQAILGNIGTIKPYVITGGTMTANPLFPLTRLVFTVVASIASWEFQPRM